MKKSAGRDSNWHPGPQIASIPVAGGGGLIFAVGTVLTFGFGMPEGKWFLIASLPAGIVALLVIRLVHKLRPRTEEEEVELDLIGERRRKDDERPYGQEAE